MTYSQLKTNSAKTMFDLINYADCEFDVSITLGQEQPKTEKVVECSKNREIERFIGNR